MNIREHSYHPWANHITRWVLSHADCTDFHGFFFYFTQITRIAQRLRRKECAQHVGYAECTHPGGHIQATARYALCSLRPLCEANIHHSVRKKQSKFCLNSVGKKIFVNIRVIRGQIPPRGGSYRTQIARIFTDSFFTSHRSHESHRGCVARSARSLSAAPSVHDWWAFSENYVLMFLCQKRVCRQKNRVTSTKDRSVCSYVLMSKKSL